MTVYQRGDHRSQYDPGEATITRTSGCTWTSGANGAREATGGDFDHSATYIHTLVARSEETSPDTPGWSLADLDLAMARAGIPFSIGTGGWAGVEAVHASGRGIVLQGDSDQFAGSTCSGAFDGNHAIYIHPETNADGLWLIGDPICSNWRWEKPSVLRNYAEKFSPGVKYGIFTTPVPKLDTPQEDYVAQLNIIDHTPKRIVIPKGTKRRYQDGIADGYVFGAQVERYSPFATAGGYRAFYVTVDSKVVIRLVGVPAANIYDLAVPADLTPFSQADLDQAVQTYATRIANIKAKVSAIAVDVADD